MIRILYLEDDLIIGQEVRSYLISKGHSCDLVFDGELFFRQEKKCDYDVLVLDINVPLINGLEVCRRVREYDLEKPILILTAFGEIQDKVDAFRSGADDYLVKPFHLEELFHRILALHKRKRIPQHSHEILQVSDLVINFDNKTVRRDEEEILLTPKEFKLLSILAKANGRVVSKQQIADELWDYHIETNQNTIEVYINFLRNKLDRHNPVKLIHTKVGFGYYLKAQT